MKKTVIIWFLLVGTVYAQDDETWVQKEQYTITYDADQQEKLPINFCFQQHCDIDNKQNVEYHHAVGQSASENNSATSWLPSWVPFGEFITPFRICASGIMMVLFYYFKTKTTLYSLSQSCVETAFWSLWNMRKQSDIVEDQKEDVALLYDILQTYRTDNQALAISRFLHDIDHEIQLLQEYLKEIGQTHNSLMRFVLPDMSKDILEAEARLSKLAYLKQKVLAWLAYQKMERADTLWS